MKKFFNHTKRPYDQWSRTRDDGWEWDDINIDDINIEEAGVTGPESGYDEAAGEPGFEAEYYGEPEEYYEEAVPAEEPETYYGEAEPIEEPKTYYGEAELSEEPETYYGEVVPAEEMETYYQGPEPEEYYEEAEPVEEPWLAGEPEEYHGGAELTGESEEYYEEFAPAGETAYYEESENGGYYGDAEDAGYDEEPEDGVYDEASEALEYYGEEEEPGRTADLGGKGNQGARRTSGLAAFFLNMGVMDRAMTIVGAAVLLLALLTGGVYVHAKAAEKQMAEFISVGTQLDEIEIIGDKGLLAVGDAAAARMAAAQLLEQQAGAQQQKDYNEADYSHKVTVALELVSVQKDLKIKFVNKDTDKLVSNVPFSVAVITAGGKAETWSDDDMDGIIYKKNITPGNYKVTVNALTGEKYANYTLPTDTQKVEVKKDIAYKKVDVSNEVKKESQVNLATEEQKKKQMAVESELTDTVEWVESTCTANTYIEVPLGDIPSPATLALQPKEGSFLRMANVSGGDSVSISVDQAELSVMAGASVGVKATAQANGAAVVYTAVSADGTIADASVDGSGNVTVTGKAAGVTTVTVTAVSASNAAAAASASVRVTVTANASLALDAAEKTVLVGETVTIRGTLMNAADGTALSAVSSDASVASVTVNGSDIIVRGEKIGTANITVTGAGAAAVCSVTVKANPKNDTATRLKDKNGNQLYIQEGDNYREAVYADFYREGIKFFKRGEIKYTGWQTIDGRRYYFDASGKKVTGEQVIQGARYNFSSDGALVTDTVMGIDVSKHNGNIDWNAVKNSGVSYVIIRCGYRGYTQGSLIEDPKFAQNIKGASAAGLKVGIYFFSQAVDEVEAVQEASFALDAVKGYNISYPIFLDVEYSGADKNKGRADGLDRATRTAVCRAFCATIEDGGYRAGIYANKTWLEEKLDPGQLGGYKIWLAQYAKEPTYRGRYDMWQYSSKGSISGIKGNVDLNLSYLGY